MSTVFSEDTRNRNLNFLMRISAQEREFLREEAKLRGIRVVTLVRQCLRSELCRMPVQAKKAASK